MPLKLRLIEFFVVERTKIVRQSSECPDQLEVRSKHIDSKPDARSFSKVESFFRFYLRLRKGISCSQKIRDQLREAVCCVCKISHPVSDIEGMTQQVATVAWMFLPHDNDFETQTIASLIALQAVPLHQIVAELAKFECTLVVAEARSGYNPKPQISKA